MRLESYTPTSYGSVPISAFSDGHGERVAAMAVGNSLGVANEANLVVVKLRGSSGRETAAGAYDAWKWMVADVKRRSKQGKAVINYSGGKNPSWSPLSQLTLIHTRMDGH